MATRIILTVDEDLTAEEVCALNNMLGDAVWEFAGMRRDAEAYVNKNYKSDAVYAGEARVRKIAQVEQRVALALKVHGALLGQTRAERIEPPAEEVEVEGLPDLSTFDDTGAL